MPALTPISYSSVMPAFLERLRHPVHGPSVPPSQTNSGNRTGQHSINRRGLEQTSTGGQSSQKTRATLFVPGTQRSQSVEARPRSAIEANSAQRPQHISARAMSSHSQPAPQQIAGRRSTYDSQFTVDDRGQRARIVDKLEDLGISPFKRTPTEAVEGYQPNRFSRRHASRR